MAPFEPDASFARRRRGGGDGRRTPLAAVLADTAAAAPAPGPVDVFTSAAADPATTEAAAPDPTPDQPEPSGGAGSGGASARPDASAALSLADDELAALLAGAAADAHAAVEGSVEGRLAEAETKLAEALARELAGRERRHDESAALILALVRTIAAHVIPRAIAATPLDDLLADLPALLAKLEGAERVTVAVHPELAGALEARLAPVTAAAGFAGTLAVEADQGLAPGDAVVRWPAGEATRRLDARLEEAMRRCAGWLAEREASAATGEAATTTTTEGSDEH